MLCLAATDGHGVRAKVSTCTTLHHVSSSVRAHFSTGVFLDGEVVYMLMDEGAA